MISFFRKIRQKLFEQNRVTRYLVYAVGEIILVTIGILIALQVNNANQKRIEKAEKGKLVTLLKEELNENLTEFENRIAYFENCRKKGLIILEVSSGQNTSLPIDSIRKYAFEMLPVFGVTINSSRLTSSKESGKFNLLNDKESKALTEYESSLEFFQQARLQTTFIFTSEGNELMIRFGLLKNLNPLVFNGEKLPDHPSMVLSDQELIPYIQLPETYRLIYRNYNDIFTQALWLKQLQGQIKAALEILENETHD